MLVDRDQVLGHRSRSGRAVVVPIVAVLCAVLGPGDHSSASAASGQVPVSVIDRTYACDTVFVGGIRLVEARAHAGSRMRSEWARLPYAVFASGGVARTPFVDAPPQNSLAWITAGRPSPATTIDDDWLSFTARAGGTVGISKDLCLPASRRIPLTKRGLRGGAVGARVVDFDCEVPRRVLIRLRALVAGPTALRERARLFRVTNAPARRGELVMATPGGRVLAYADVSETGRAALFTARTCTPD
jgi:hypothetical protein